MGQWYDVYAYVMLGVYSILLYWPKARFSLWRAQALFVSVFMLAVHHWLAYHLAEHYSMLKDYVSVDRALYIALPIGFFVGALVSCFVKTVLAGVILALSGGVLTVVAVYFFGSWAFLAVPIAAIAIALLTFVAMKTSLGQCMRDKDSIIVYGLSGVLYMVMAFLWTAVLRFVALETGKDDASVFEDEQWQGYWYGIWAGVNVARLVESFIVYKYWEHPNGIPKHGPYEAVEDA